jgi:hypothetical protein
MRLSMEAARKFGTFSMLLYLLLSTVCFPFKNAEPIDVEVSELSTLLVNLDDCDQKLSELMDR